MFVVGDFLFCFYDYCQILERTAETVDSAFGS